MVPSMVDKKKLVIQILVIIFKRFVLVLVLIQELDCLTSTRQLLVKRIVENLGRFLKTQFGMDLSKIWMQGLKKL